MIRQMAIGIALPGFNDLGRSAISISLLMDYSLRLAKKWRKSINYEFEFFAKCTIEFPSFSSLVIGATPLNAS